MGLRGRVVGGVVAILLAWTGVCLAGEECTSAVVISTASKTGAPLLWKNRDTDVLSNRVVFVRDVPHSYLGLVNVSTPNGRQVFAGLNSAGFAIMNTVAYNLPKQSGEMEDLEGIVMADALRTCATVEEFERYLQAGLGPDLGSWANFGAIDSSGKAWLFEVHNHGYQRLDAAAAEAGYLLNTNFARSGAEGKGAGYLRFERAERLFSKFPRGGVDPRTILTRFTRDLGHVLLRQPGLDEARATPSETELWAFTRDCINRPSTSAAAVIVGRNPADAHSVATMWVIPGEPVTAIAVPVWVEAGASPAPLWEGEEAPLWRESLRIKRIIHPKPEGNKKEYLDLTRLENADGTGFLPALLAAEAAIVDETEQFLKRAHTAEELRTFQDAMAARALATLQSIR